MPAGRRRKKGTVLICASRAPSEAWSRAVSANGTQRLPGPLFSAAQAGQSNLQRAKAAAVELIESLGADTEVAVAEAAGALRLVAPFQPAGREAARAVASIEPFDGPADLPAAMQQALDLWGESEDCEIYVFTDAPLPESGWGRRAHAWIAPAAGDNRGIVALSAQRQGKKILAEFTLANYAARPQKLTGTVLVNGVPRRAFAMPPLDPGESRRRQVAVDEPEAASLVVRLDGPPDALAVDDEACIRVPALEDLRVRVAWPAGAKHNAYVAALLSLAGGARDHWPDHRWRRSALSLGEPVPEAWPDGGVLVLDPLRGGAMGVAGLCPEPVTVTRQAPHPLLAGVELRGLVVKDAVRVQPPAWAEPIVWAGDLPLVWAGQHGKGKALILAMPVSSGESQLPLLASFPVLMRNACRWMLPQPQVRRPGEMIDGWTSRRAGLIENPNDGQVYAFSTLGAAESDLRRPASAEEPPLARRRPLAAILVVLALVLMPIEWGLFHRRFTE